MPALIAVLSPRGGAGELARRAVRPVARREWERVDLWVDGDDRVAIGFVGATGGLAVADGGRAAAVDGELFVDDVPVSGAPAAAAVISASDHGDELGTAEGSYAAAIWDPRRSVLVAATDRYGTRPLYVARRADATLVASELKSLLATLAAPPSLAVDAAAVLLAYEHLFPRQTLLEEIDAVPAATTLTVDGAGGHREHRRWRYELAPGRIGDEREWVEEFGRLLDRAVRRRVDPGTAVAVSGGLDSRCVVLSLARQGIDAPAVSWGAPDSEDVVLGAAVAAAAGLRHRTLTLPPGYLAAWASEASWLSEGRSRVLSCHHLAALPLREDGIRSLLIGFGGDDTMRAWSRRDGRRADARFVRHVHRLRATCVDDGLLEAALVPAFATALRGRAEGALRAELATDIGEPAARLAQLRFRNTQSPTLFADAFPARDPFSDHELVDFARTIPWELRRRGRLERLFLRSDPALSRLPTTHGGTSPGASPAAIAAASARTRARRLLRLSVPDTLGIGSYARDLRHGSRRLLGVLVETRTLERGQLAETAARQLVDATLAGRLRDMRAVGVLLTLELFQRQFVDGDRPPSDRGAAASPGGRRTRFSTNVRRLPAAGRENRRAQEPMLRTMNVSGEAPPEESPRPRCT